jgi:hypothetical protein
VQTSREAIIACTPIRRWASESTSKPAPCRVWEEAVPAGVSVQGPERVYIRNITPEWRCWERHLGRSIPVDSRGGWWFPSKLPPLPVAAVPEEVIVMGRM